MYTYIHIHMYIYIYNTYMYNTYISRCHRTGLMFIIVCHVITYHNIVESSLVCYSTLHYDIVYCTTL